MNIYNFQNIDLEAFVRGISPAELELGKEKSRLMDKIKYARIDRLSLENLRKIVALIDGSEGKE